MAASVRIRVADMEWFQDFAAGVLDLILEVEGEEILVTDAMKERAADVRRLSRGVYPGPGAAPE